MEPVHVLKVTTLPIARVSRCSVDMPETSTPRKDLDMEVWLRSTDWMQMIPEEARKRVILDSFDSVYEAKDIVARKGESARYWIGVMSGLLKVSTVTASGRNVMFTAVPGGSWVGEGSVIKREPRKYDLLAIRQSRVMHIPRSTFLWLLETSIEFNRFVIDYLNERSGQFIAMLENSRVEDHAGRVAGAICGLLHPVLYPKGGPLLHISQEELGELVGLSRSTIHAALNRLRNLGLIQAEYGSLLVSDSAALREFANSVSEAPTGNVG